LSYQVNFDGRGGGEVAARGVVVRGPRSITSMAQVDVDVETVIRRPRDVVASYAAEPDNATEWYVNIKNVQWETPRPLTQGSQFAFTAQFLGRKLTYTYQVVEFLPHRRFVMRTAEGPFPMETTYEWDDVEPDSTRMTLRNRGEPSGFSGIAAPVIAAAMKRANAKDLERLKVILESQGG
jgi:Polyketide cyclase / dehydrase and lipid transport